MESAAKELEHYVKFKPSLTDYRIDYFKAGKCGDYGWIQCVDCGWIKVADYGQALLLAAQFAIQEKYGEFQITDLSTNTIYPRIMNVRNALAFCTARGLGDPEAK